MPGTTTAADWEAILPKGLIDRLVHHYGEQDALSIVQGFASPRKTTLRANTLKTTRDALAAQLQAAGIACKNAPASALCDALAIDRAHEPAARALDAYEQGQLYLQSLSAMLPALALDPRPGENILDMAAAPGGKTCQMAALANNQALICACEKNHIRAERLRYNLRKQGVQRVNVMECDARKLDEFFRFDKVLLDAPCSGSGTIRLEGDACKTGYSEELVRRSVKTQKALLRRALQAIGPGGTVVYATCSVLPDENEDVLESVLPSAHARLEPLPEGLLEGVPVLPCRLPEAAVVRPTSYFEGFFLALIKK